MIIHPFYKETYFDCEASQGEFLIFQLVTHYVAKMPPYPKKKIW